MGRIKKLVILTIIPVILFFSACENTLLQNIEERIQVTHEISIDFTYLGPYQLSLSMPVYLRFYPAPFEGDPETDPAVTNIKITKSGTTVIKDSDLAPSTSGTYFVMIVHDMDNNGIDNDDPKAFYVDNGTNDMTYDISSYIISTQPDPIDLEDEAKMTFGNSYSISYLDEGGVIDDAYESDDLYAGVSNTLTLGQGQIHTLGDLDKDYIKLTVSDWDYYRVEVTDQGACPEIQLSVYQLEGDGTLSLHGSYYSATDGGLPARVDDLLLGPGTTYYVYITATNSLMGTYSVNYNYQPKAEDAFEDGSADDNPSTTTNHLELDRNYQDHTFHETDTETDWADYLTYTLDYVNIDAYALEIVPPAGYERATVFEGDGRLSAVIDSENTTYGGVVEMFDGYPRLYLNAMSSSTKQKVTTVGGPVEFVSGAEYASGPRGDFRMRLVAGPDVADINGGFNYDDDTLADSSVNGFSEIYISDTDKVWRSIYPEGDIDFIKFHVTTAGSYTIDISKGSVDGIDTVFDIQYSNGTNFATGYSTTSGPLYYSSTGYYYIKVEKAGFATQETGAYLVDIIMN